MSFSRIFWPLTAALSLLSMAISLELIAEPERMLWLTMAHPEVPALLARMVWDLFGLVAGMVAILCFIAQFWRKRLKFHFSAFIPADAGIVMGGVLSAIWWHSHPDANTAVPIFGTFAGGLLLLWLALARPWEPAASSGRVPFATH